MYIRMYLYCTIICSTYTWNAIFPVYCKFKQWVWYNPNHYFLDSQTDFSLNNLSMYIYHFFHFIISIAAILFVSDWIYRFLVFFDLTLSYLPTQRILNFSLQVFESDDRGASWQSTLLPTTPGCFACVDATASSIFCPFDSVGAWYLDALGSSAFNFWPSLPLQPSSKQY